MFRFICMYIIHSFFDFITSIYSVTPTDNLIVNPSLEFGLHTHHLQDGSTLQAFMFTKGAVGLTLLGPELMF